MKATPQQLILDVMDGNPGALMVMSELIRHPLWHPLFRYLRAQGLVGSVLWSVVKDEYGGDTSRFSRDQIATMTQNKWERLCGILR